MKDYKNILICDDSEFIRETLRVFLSDLKGYRLTFAGDGKEALDHVSHENYDLIIMDIQMPYFSGTELIRLIREVNHIETPIIVLTGHLKDSSIREKLDDYYVQHVLTKPFSPAILIDRINETFVKHATV